MVSHALFPLALALALLLCRVAHTQDAYSDANAKLLVGAQLWNESGWYADTGFQQGYYGYFCLCTCYGTNEGIFCQGGGVRTDFSVVENFLGVFAQDGPNGDWTGDLVAYSVDNSGTNAPPFSDHFLLHELGGPSNYTGVSQAAGAQSFVWRGYMSGVSCKYKDYCDGYCTDNADDSSMYLSWSKSC